MPDVAEIAKSLTEAQRHIMAGHLIDIPPEEARALQDTGLKGDPYWTEEPHGRRLVWPITPTGLAVRAYLENSHD